MTQDQNGLLQTGLPQLQGLAHTGYTEKGDLGLQQPGHLDGAVAVGIGLDDGHDGNLRLALDGIKVGQNGIHVDIYIGVVIQQRDHLRYKCAFLLCYHKN